MYAAVVTTSHLPPCKMQHALPTAHVLGRPRARHDSGCVAAAHLSRTRPFAASRLTNQHPPPPDVDTPSRDALAGRRRPRQACQARAGRGSAAAAASAAPRWRLERTHEAGAALDEQLFRLAPTDASSPGSLITWALVFPRCPKPERVFSALDDLLSAFPLFAGRPTARRYEVLVSPGRGVAAEFGVDDARSAEDVVASGLGFAHAPLAFPAAPAELLPYLALPPDVAAMDKGQAPLL